VLNLKQYLL